MTSGQKFPHSEVSGARSRAWWMAIGLSAAISLLMVAPFFVYGSASGHDFEFHAASWLDVAAQWKQGTLYPRWMEWANHGFGEPRFIFYPPLSWMLGAALSFLVPGKCVPIAFIILVQTLAGACAFSLARRFLPERAALFAALFYASNPNALLIVYIRSDFAELLAMALFPLLFLFALRLAGILAMRPDCRRGTMLFFAFTFAAVWLSNVPAGVMASYSTALLFGWAALTEKSCKPLLQGFSGIFLGLGLSAFYLLPAAYEQRWVNIGQVLSTGLLPAQNFLYTAIDDPEHNLFNWIASTIAVLMIVITLLAALLERRSHAQASPSTEEQRNPWSAFLFLAAVATLLMLHPSYLLWNWLPKLRFVQFPWRWMSILAVPFACFLAAALARKRIRWLWVTALAALLAGNALFLVHATWWDADDIPTLQEAMASGAGFDGTDEYDPLGDDHTNLPATAPRAVFSPNSEEASSAAPAEVTVERWTAKDKDVRVQSREPGSVALRLLNYPAWRVEVNGQRVQPEHPAESEQMIVRVPSGDSRITVHFERTPDRTLGIAISLASLFFVALAWVGKNSHAASEPSAVADGAVSDDESESNEEKADPSLRPGTNRRDSAPLEDRGRRDDKF